MKSLITLTFLASTLSAGNLPNESKLRELIMKILKKLKEAAILQIPNWLLLTFALLCLFRRDADFQTLFAFFALLVATYTYRSESKDWDIKLIINLVRLFLFAAMILTVFLNEFFWLLEKIGF